MDKLKIKDFVTEQDLINRGFERVVVESGVVKNAFARRTVAYGNLYIYNRRCYISNDEKVYGNYSDIYYRFALQLTESWLEKVNSEVNPPITKQENTKFQRMTKTELAVLLELSEVKYEAIHEMLHATDEIDRQLAQREAETYHNAMDIMKKEIHLRWICGETE